MEQRVIPMLAYEDAGRAAEWITKVFGFREVERFHNGAGTVTDVVLDLDGATVLVGHPSDAYQGPRRHAQACALARHAHGTWGEWGERGEFLMVNLYPAVEGEITRARVGFVVDELEPVHARLLSAGARVITAPERRPWGASATYEDPDGNTVSLSERPHPTD